VPEDARIPVRIEATGYLRLHIPDDLPAGPAAAVVALHGYAQPPEEMLAYARSVAPDDAIVVAPEGPSARYTRRKRVDGVRQRGVLYGWIADDPRQPSERRNRDLIRRALEQANAVHPLDPARTVFLGYSQGAGVATDYFVHAPAQAAGLIGLAGGVPAHGRRPLAALAGKSVLWVCGETDESYPPLYMDGVVEDFERAGAALERRVVPTGHDVLDAARGAVAAWLTAHCSAEPAGRGSSGP